MFVLRSVMKTPGFLWRHRRSVTAPGAGCPAAADGLADPVRSERSGARIPGICDSEGDERQVIEDGGRGLPRRRKT